MKKLIFLAVLFFGMASIQAQTKEELQKEKAEKQAEADAAQGEANAIQAKIDAFPGWKKGAQLAFPNRVTCCKLLPSTLQVYISMLVGITRPCFNKSLYSLMSASV